MHPNRIRFQSAIVFEFLGGKVKEALRPLGFSGVATDKKANRKWLIHDSGMWNECQYVSENEWVSSFGFVV